MKKKLLSFSLILLLIATISIYWFTRPIDFNLDKLHIVLTENDFSQLENLKNEAHKLGRLERSENDFFPVTMSYLKETISGKIRLKGDFLDHLGEEKWSFRIKLDDPMKDGLQVFSVQNPGSRGYVEGYLYHKMMRDEGILSNEFRFIEVYVNNESWGVYCLEEHLSKRMITSQDKPKGVLLKFTDDAFFSADNTDAPGLIGQAEIKVYGEDKKNELYKLEVANAKQILSDYQLQTDSVYNLFDPSVTGTYYAINDLMTAYHAMGWINVRFYYNFETQKMEPVAYDPFPVLDWGKPYLGKNCFDAHLDPLDTKMIVYKALHNADIADAYYLALKRICQSDYVESFLERYQTEIEFFETEIQKEYSYAFDADFLRSRAIEILNSLTIPNVNMQ